MGLGRSFVLLAEGKLRVAAQFGVYSFTFLRVSNWVGHKPSFLSTVNHSGIFGFVLALSDLGDVSAAYSNIFESVAVPVLDFEEILRR